MIKPITNVPALRYDRPQAGAADERGRTEDGSDRRIDHLVVGDTDGSRDNRPHTDRRRGTRNNSAFLTHLIAGNENVEQLRARRRAAPEIGAASYVSPKQVERASQTGALLAISA